MKNEHLKCPEGILPKYYTWKFCRASFLESISTKKNTWASYLFDMSTFFFIIIIFIEKPDAGSSLSLIFLYISCKVLCQTQFSIAETFSDLWDKKAMEKWGSKILRVPSSD